MKLSQLSSEEYPAYYQKYLDHLPDEELLLLLKSQQEDFTTFLGKLEPEDLKKSYGEGKWTVAEVLQHILDTERIFQYRALRIGRGDKTSLPGFDQDAYVPVSLANRRNPDDFKEEYFAVRSAGLALFKSFTEEMLRSRGISSGGTLSAASAGFIMCGHQKHHYKLFKTHYKL